ncbi:MAG: N-formylglutamate amidohydrolase [Candidatus Nealsonbacteria bacterium]|nr:N-formylglutamate amidohydrolase [Candidatus Nealsonbacteria bacterium]
MKLPIAVSVPHAGLRIPPEAAADCQLTREQILKDSDEGAAEIYDLREEVAEFITTDVARAIVDLNRPPDDRRPDGVVKTHTIWNEPVYHAPLSEHVIDTLLDKYYHPYHARLSSLAGGGLLFAVDCHTMVAEAPPIGPDPGTKRPEVCLGNARGRSFPEAWTALLDQAFQEAFAGFRVTLNDPFVGGYITQAHGKEMPWVQIEISRSAFLPRCEIRGRVLRALQNACREINVCL